MAKNNEIVSINKLEKYCERNPVKEVPLTFAMGYDDELMCMVKTRLSLEETLKFIEEVVAESVSEEDMMVFPVANDYMFRKCILTYYGNFTLPKNDGRAYEIVMACDEIVEAIKNTVDKHQLENIQQCISERIAFEKQKMLAASEYQMSLLMGKVRELTEKMETAFGGVSGDQISSFISNMTEMAKGQSITAQDLAAAIVARNA